MTVRDLMLVRDECEVVDVDEHFHSLGLERTHTKSRRKRVPASLREPLEPLVLDKARAKKATWAVEPKMIAELLETVAQANAKVVPAGGLVGLRSDFECVSAPPMSITAYMRQLSVLGHESAWPAVLSILDRLGRYAEMPFTPLTAHRLVLTAFSLASREIISECEASTTQRVAKVAGVSHQDLQKMEGSLLKLLSSISADVSWDTLIGMHDAPLIKACLPRVVRSALRDHALRAVCPSQSVTHILPAYLDCMSSAEPSPTSSCSSTSPFTVSARRIQEAKQFALAHAYTSADEG
eukprot:TRINITY_DN38586_c0_g1_i1.p1 TRINITY_DN38586_c0_g1~~TRINITY_DN38586_c0_g1_i1.p1  ORF type:complete len:333 (+),score=52.83 TRINITY_DN38586_c0_g1_i1:115-999(+)